MGSNESKPNGQSNRNWSSVERIVVTDRHAFIYTSTIEAFILPKRAFEDETHCQEFIEQVAKQASIVPS